MKILPLVKGIQEDISSSCTRLKKVAKNGYTIADRSAHIYKLGSAGKYWNAARSISDKIIKSTSKNDIPYIAGAIGMMLPIPLSSPLFLLLGFFVRYSIPNDIYDENFNQDEKSKININV